MSLLNSEISEIRMLGPVSISCLYIASFVGLYILSYWGRILVQVTIYRRLLIGRDGHLDQSEAYDIS